MMSISRYNPTNASVFPKAFAFLGGRALLTPDQLYRAVTKMPARAVGENAVAGAGSYSLYSVVGGDLQAKFVARFHVGNTYIDSLTAVSRGLLRRVNGDKISALSEVDRFEEKFRSPGVHQKDMDVDMFHVRLDLRAVIIYLSEKPITASDRSAEGVVKAAVANGLIKLTDSYVKGGTRD